MIFFWDTRRTDSRRFSLLATTRFLFLLLFTLLRLFLSLFLKKSFGLIILELDVMDRSIPETCFTLYTGDIIYTFGIQRGRLPVQLLSLFHQNIQGHSP